MTSQTTKNRFHESGEAEVIRYRAIEPMAAISLIFGLASIVAAFDLVGCFIAVPAIILGLFSLARIKKRPEVFIGRKAAILSLVLALFFCSTGIAHRVTTEYLTRRQATIIGQEFLELIASDQPEVAFKWTLSPQKRSNSNKDIWAFYNSDSDAAEALKEFTNREDLRTLLAIGPNAKIYPVGRANYIPVTNTESVNQLYAIDFQSEGKTKTFFFSILLRRTLASDTAPSWTIIDLAGGIDPWKKQI